MKEKKTRCAVKKCKKKLNMIEKVSGVCKCEKIFCPEHRLSTNHSCEFDFKNDIDKEKFIRENDCKFSKIDKI